MNTINLPALTDQQVDGSPCGFHRSSPWTIGAPWIQHGGAYRMRLWNDARRAVALNTDSRRVNLRV